MLTRASLTMNMMPNTASQRRRLDAGFHSNFTQLYGVNWKAIRLILPLRNNDALPKLSHVKRKRGGAVTTILLVSGNVPKALPLIWLHGQPGQRLHATVDAQTIAQQHVHDPLGQQIHHTSSNVNHSNIKAAADADDDKCTYVIPPAFGKVGQLVLQAVLQELKHDTNDHAHPPVPNHQRLRAGKARKVVSRIPPVGVGHIAGGQRCESERVAGQAYLDIPPQEVSRDKAVHLVLSGGKGGGDYGKQFQKCILLSVPNVKFCLLYFFQAK